MERGGVGGLVVGTLLGPEGTGPPGLLRRPGVGWLSLEGFMPVVPPVSVSSEWAGVWRWGRWGDFPYFENCTVDASI